MENKHRHNSIAAIIAIAGLEALAILKGIDGTVLALVIAVISGLGGYNIQKYLSTRIKQ